MPSTHTAGTTVRREVTVPLDANSAFELFTARFDAWWPREHHIGGAELAEAVLEPRAGGRWYERGSDGSQCEWGRVARWEPPTRLVLDWQINGEWRYDPQLHTEVEITFTEEAPGRTTVALEHRNLDRFGEHLDAVRAAFESPGGWEGTLKRYAALAAG